MERSTARQRSNAHARRRQPSGQAKRLHLFIAMLASVCAIAISAVVLLTMPSPPRESSPNSTATIGLAPQRTASTAEMDIAPRCRRIRFDERGQMFEDVVLCEEQSARDVHGRLVPAGTMRRLDAISKSFSR